MRNKLDNLTTRIFLFATLLASVAILTLAFSFNAYQWKGMLRERESDMANKIHGSDGQIRQAIDTLRRDAVFLVHTPPVSGIQRAAANNGFDRRDANSIETWEKRLQEIFTAFVEAKPMYQQVRYIGIADNGRELVRVDLGSDGHGKITPSDRLQAEGDRGFFQATLKLKAGEVYLSGFNPDNKGTQAEAVQRPALCAATPVFTPDGRLFGLIAIDMAIDSLFKGIDQDLPAGALTYLLNEDGDFLAPSAAERTLGFVRGRQLRWQDEILGLMQAKATSRTKESNLRHLSSSEGELHALAGFIQFDPLRPERKLFLAYGLPDSELQNALRPMRIVIILVTLAGIGLAIGLIIFLLSRVFAPLRGISLAAEAIADGNYDTSIPVVQDHEIGALGQALRHMQARVAAREGELLALASDLEVRVEARTADLQLAVSVFHNTTEGIMVTGVDSTIISVNPAFTEITGYLETEAIGNKSNLLRSDRHGPEFYRSLWHDLNLFGRWQGEIWNRRKNGEAYLEWLTINRILDGNGRPYRYVAVFRDITDMHRKDQHIRHLAYHDALTGLPNRLLLIDRLTHGTVVARRESHKVGLMFVDLDRFKCINDSFGHDVGDKLLEEVAQRLATCVRDSDTVARIGGDEFVILLPKMGTLADGAALAEKLIDSLTIPMSIAGHAIQIGASVGVAVFPEDGANPDDLMKNADAAMYAAKRAGRGTYRFFHSMTDIPS